jgi:hypothetical protein
MNTGGLVSEEILTSNRLGVKTQSQSADSRSSFTSAGAAFGPGLPSAERNTSKSVDVRSIVAGRFMRMLRSHDRMRSKLLAAAVK